MRAASSLTLSSPLALPVSHPAHARRDIRCIPNPLDTSVYLTGVNKTGHIFKSKMMPVVVEMAALRNPTPRMLGVTPESTNANDGSGGGHGGEGESNDPSSKSASGGWLGSVGSAFGEALGITSTPSAKMGAGAGEGKAGGTPVGSGGHPHLTQRYVFCVYWRPACTLCHMCVSCMS